MHRYHGTTNVQFLNAVALGQVTPWPVVQTVALVGYAAAVVAFTPFCFVLLGPARFDRLRGDTRARAFLNGAGAAAIGATFCAAVPLAFALHQPWQFAVLATAAIALLPFRRRVVVTLIAAGIVGSIAGQLGAPLP